MHVEQAIFTSARTRHAQGYHLTSWSPGITDEVAKALALWSPSHGGLIDSAPGAVSLSYFPLPTDVGVLARSVYGGPEYSDRGGLQIVTRMLVLHSGQLAGYANNPLLLARVALALGHLRLGGSLEHILEPVEIPDRTVLVDSANDNGGSESSLTDPRDIPKSLGSSGPDFPANVPSVPVRQLAERLRTGSRVAVVGAANPGVLLEELLRRTHPQHRLQMSFTTGLWPSMQRKFRVQFLPATGDDPKLIARLRGQLAAQGVECICPAA